MQIERDTVEFLSGVRAGQTHRLADRDADREPRLEELAGHHGSRRRARAIPIRGGAPSRACGPGHADLTGLLKYDRDDARDILERASARETTARVAAGAICKRLLVRVRRARSAAISCTSAASTRRARTRCLTTSTRPPTSRRCARSIAEAEARDDRAHRRRSSAKATRSAASARWCADGLPVGLGSHVSWDRKLDGRLGAAIMSIPAVKGVEIGMGFEAARRTGAEVHDEIEPAPGRTRAGNVRRKTNRAGGLEGGMTTGEPLVRARGDEADQHADAAARARSTWRPVKRRPRPRSAATSRRCRRWESLPRRWRRSCSPRRALEKFGGDSLARNEAEL